MKKLIILLAAVFIAAAFSGCSTLETDTEALMQPPSLTEEQAKLNDALKSVIGDSFYLKYPMNEGSNSAFMFCDLDEDGTEEALAFYSVREDENGTRINIMKNTGGSWTSVYEAAGSTGDISDVHFLDTGSEMLLVVKWEKEVGIYQFVNSRLEQIYMAPSDGIELADMNGDEISDIVVFSGAFDGRSSARVVYSTADGIQVSEHAYMTAEYSKIYSVVCGGLGDGRKALFVDSVIYDNVYLTEILTIDDGRTRRDTIASFMKDETEEEATGTGFTINTGKRGMYARNTAAVCTDIDGDGVIEMPVEIREDSADTENNRFYFIEYVKYNGEEALPVWYGFSGGEDGFVFRLEEEWTSGVEISYDPAFDEYNFTETENGGDVLSIRAARTGDYQDIYEENEVLAGKNGTKSFYVTIMTKEGEKYHISPGSCKERFSFVK